MRSGFRLVTTNPKIPGLMVVDAKRGVKTERSLGSRGTKTKFTPCKGEDSRVMDALRYL